MSRFVRTGFVLSGRTLITRRAECPHLRVDFYYVNEKIYFGVILIFPGMRKELFEVAIVKKSLGKFTSNKK